MRFGNVLNVWEFSLSMTKHQHLLLRRLMLMLLLLHLLPLLHPWQLPFH